MEFGRAGSFLVSFNCCLDSLVGALPMLFTHWGKSQDESMVAWLEMLPTEYPHR